VAYDLTLNLLELKADRRAGDIRHATTPPPTPAALTLTEVAVAAPNALSIAKVATALSGDLLTAGGYSKGQVGPCLQPINASLERVVDLQTIKRASGAAGLQMLPPRRHGLS
jgi:hypothetical protein